MGMLKSVRKKVNSVLGLGQEKQRIGVYGPPNSGKSTLTNQICQDWSDGPLGTEGPVPHETRKARKEENVTIEHNNSEVTIDIVDTPGVDTTVSEEEFIDFGMDEDSSRQRAREATEGIAEAMHWLREDVDGVVYMIDSTTDPLSQVNTMILGIIDSQNLPVVVLANKIDLDEADAKRVANAFPQHTTVPVSAKERENMDNVYRQIAQNFGD